ARCAPRWIPSSCDAWARPDRAPERDAAPSGAASLPRRARADEALGPGLPCVPELRVLVVQVVEERVVLENARRAVDLAQVVPQRGSPRARLAARPDAR